MGNIILNTMESSTNEAQPQDAGTAHALVAYDGPNNSNTTNSN